MTAPGVEVKLTGPLFQPGVSRKIVNEINQALDKVAKVGEGHVKQQLYPGHGLITGNLRESVAGDLVKDLHAVIDAGEHVQGANVVYAEAVESGRGSFRGYRMFGRTADYLRQGTAVNEIRDRLMRLLK